MGEDCTIFPIQFRGKKNSSYVHLNTAMNSVSIVYRANLNLASNSLQPSLQHNFFIDWSVFKSNVCLVSWAISRFAKDTFGHRRSWLFLFLFVLDAIFWHFGAHGGYSSIWLSNGKTSRVETIRSLHWNNRRWEGTLHIFKLSLICL